MADLVKALEADLFGSYEWAAELYADLLAAPEAYDRLLVAQGLVRAFEALDREEDAARAAEAMAAAEDALPAADAKRLGALIAAREALLDAEDPAMQVATLAPAFLDEFEARWAEGPREPLVADALLAALVRANLIASRDRPVPGEPRPEALAHHRRAGDLYAAAAAAFEERAKAGALVWRDSARGAWNRAMVAWRAIGDESRARLADDAARGLGQGAGSYR